MEVEVRPYTLADVPAMHGAILESLDHLRPWMPWVAFEPLTLAQRLVMVRKWLDEGTENLAILVDGAYAGVTGLHDRIGATGREIGYWVRVSMIGRGIATETARQLTVRTLALPLVDHVEIHHDRANVASGICSGARKARIHARARGPGRGPGARGVRRSCEWRYESS